MTMMPIKITHPTEVEEGDRLVHKTWTPELMRKNGYVVTSIDVANKKIWGVDYTGYNKPREWNFNSFDHFKGWLRIPDKGRKLIDVEGLKEYENLFI